MRGFLKGIVLLPIAVVVVLLAVANREAVLFSFDPFSTGVPEISVTLPLFALLFAAVAFGVLIGGIATWLAQGENRRARRQSAREISRLRSEADRLRASTRGTGLPAVSSPRPL